MRTSLEGWDARLRELFGLSLLAHPARLRDGLRAACRDLAIDDDAELLTRVDRGDRAAKSALTRALTIGETYFFREAQHFELLRDALLPRALARGQPRITLVSAGCASGEEAYSLAIAANESLGQAAAERVRVLGFDINERALARARRGSYRPWSLRGVPDPVRRRWFERAGDEWRIGAAARSLTRFERRNLVDPAGCLPRSSSDVIFCRNVLIYLSEDAITLALRELSRALRPGGVLLVGSAEAACFRAAGLGAHRLDDVWVHGYGERPSGASRAAAELATRRPRSTAGAASTYRRAPPFGSGSRAHPRSRGASPGPRAPSPRRPLAQVAGATRSVISRTAGRRWPPIRRRRRPTRVARSCSTGGSPRRTSSPRPPPSPSRASARRAGPSAMRGGTWR